MPKKPSPLSETNNEQRINDVYAALLNILDLSKEHAAALNARGFSDVEIKTNQYKTLPTRRIDIVDKLAKQFDNNLNGVPGFWLNNKGAWELAGKCGILIPIRNPDKLITGLKVRVDKPNSPSAKYLLISSNPKAEKDGEVKYPNGTSAKIAIHFPLDKPKSIKALRITEGELKADMATGILPQYTVSIPGVTSWRLGVELAKELKPAKVLLAFDSDKSKPLNNEGSNDFSYIGKDSSMANHPSASTPDDFAVGKALSSLYLALKTEGINAAIEHWPESAGKGIDDVIMTGATDLIKELTEEEAEEFCKQMLAGDSPQDWIYVIGIKRFVHMKTFLELDKEQFVDRYCHETKGNPALKALANPSFPKVDLPIYTPKREILYSQDGKRFLNTWRGIELQPEEGSIELFLSHCEYMIPNEEERNIFLDWMAFNVQNPGSKIHWAILMQGIQGTGKSYFGWIMRLLLGSHNISSPTNEQIHEVYTAWQKSCQLVIIEEVMARGRLELMNKLKPIITQDIAVVREMQKPAYEQPNVFNLLMFTNHQDAIILDETDRRYCVIFSPALPKESKYYENLWAWTQENAGRLLHFMLCRNLSGFKPKAHAPMTEGKREIIKGSKTPLEAWLCECIETENWPFQGDLVSVNHLIECMPRTLREVSIQGLGKGLKAIGAQPVGQVMLSTGGQARLWAVRRHEVWAGAKKETLAAEYEKWSNKSQPGGNPLLEARPF